FDLSRREMTGDAVAVFAGVADGGMDAPFVTSRSGDLALTPRPSGEAQRRLSWIDAQGRAAPIEGATGPYEWADVSRDGQRVVYELHEASRTDPPKEIRVLDLERRTPTCLRAQGIADKAIWNPDGEKVTYGSGLQEGPKALWERRADGTDEAARLYAPSGAEALLIPLSWTSDGKVLAFERYDGRR